MKNRLRKFGHIDKRFVDFVVRILSQMEKSQTTRGREKHRKTIKKIMKDLEINNLDKNIVLNKILLRKMIYVTHLHLMT